MKIVFLSLALFLFTRVSSQVSDSIELEDMRAIEQAMYESLELGIALPDFTA